MERTDLDILLEAAIMKAGGYFKERLAGKGNQTTSEFVLEVVKAAIWELDSELDGGDEEFRAAVLLVAAAFWVGPDVDRLVSLTCYSRMFVETVARRMWAYGLWADGEVCTDEWFEGDEITVVFWLHCLAAVGKVRVDRTEAGEELYSAILPN